MKCVGNMVLFDRLRKEEDRENCSVWKGEKGVYIFEKIDSISPRKPVRKVYLNRTYLTGLFRGRKKDEFLGDIKEIDGKKYLRFRISGKDQIDIFEKKYSKVS